MGKHKANEADEITDENNAENGVKERPARKNQKVSSGASATTDKQSGADKTTKKKKSPLQAIAPAQIPGGNANLEVPIPEIETPANELETPPAVQPTSTNKTVGNEASLTAIMMMMREIKSESETSESNNQKLT